MRGTRWLLLVAIAVIIGGIAAKYQAQRKALRQQAPPRPEALPLDLNSSAEEWHWEQTENKQPFRKTVEITARNFKQAKESSRVDLEQVELRLFHKDDAAYDLIKSAAAAFFANEKRLYSEGEVEITLAVPKEGEPKHQLVSILSSGVNFDSGSGKAETDRLATFKFENGDGKSTGAIYDPTTHELVMKSEVEIHWKAPTTNARPMKIEAASLNYYESKSEIWLRPWGRLTRDNSVIEGQNVVVHLKEGVIQKVDAVSAHGTDEYPNRKLEYQADQLWVEFDEDGKVSKVAGENNARLVSDTEASQTTVTARRVDLEFASQGDESVLRKVVTSGQSVAESKPKPLAGRSLPETHVLRSDVLEMTMRDGGREIERVVTHAPGVLEFLPSLPAQHRRTLNGTDMIIAYAARNQIETFRATDVRTQTEPNAEERKRNRGRSVTASHELLAKFEPNSSRMASMEQWGDFTYEEDERRARAAKATLDANDNVIVLEGAARMWDATGSTAADRIRTDQRTGNFTAEGRVNSSRLPEKKKSSEILSGDEPLQAQAQKMDSSDHNRVIHYEGKVTLWQGANRLQADLVDLNREKRMLVASGNVVSNLWEQPKQESGRPSAVPVLTVVHAPRLDYTEENRLAYYSGGVHLTRPGLDVKSRELRAWLAESGADSSLERAFADGGAQIVQTAPDRTRTGTGEHGEYYTTDQKVILRGGEAQLVDTLRGHTRAAELTYFANDDRLLVNGVPDRPARSVIRKK